MGFQLVQILYWLALATWFGGVLFVAISAPIVFRTIRAHDPTLPTVLSVNLEGQHATLLAGEIVGNILAVLVKVGLVCAGVLLVTFVVQWFYLRPAGAELIGFALRAAMLLAAAGITLYDWLSLWPRISEARREYIDNADDPDIANPAKDRFDQYHRESVMLLSVVLFLLLGVILFSGNLASRATVIDL